MTITLVGITNYHEEYDDNFNSIKAANVKIIENYIGNSVYYAILEPITVTVSSFWSEPNVTSHRLNEMFFYED